MKVTIRLEKGLRYQIDEIVLDLPKMLLDNVSPLEDSVSEMCRELLDVLSSVYEIKRFLREYQDLPLHHTARTFLALVDRYVEARIRLSELDR